MPVPLSGRYMSHSSAQHGSFVGSRKCIQSGALVPAIPAKHWTPLAPLYETRESADAEWNTQVDEARDRTPRSGRREICKSTLMHAAAMTGPRRRELSPARAREKCDVFAVSFSESFVNTHVVSILFTTVLN